MRKDLSVLVALALFGALFPTIPAIGSVLSTFTGQGMDIPSIGADRTNIQAKSYSVRHGLQRHVYVAVRNVDGFGAHGVLRIDPYGKVDWLTPGLAGNADDVWVNYDGTILYTSWDTFQVIKVLLDNTIVPLAGNGTSGYSGDGGPATNAQISVPEGITTDADGNVFFTDLRNCVVRRVDRISGIITTVAGNFALGCGYSGDGGPATAAALNDPHKLIVDSVGNLFVADSQNHIVRKVDMNGIITTAAGIPGIEGYSGDGGLATQALFRMPVGVDMDSWGNLYIAERTGHVVRKIDRDGIVTTAAGSGVGGYLDHATDARQGMFNGPAGVTVDADGHLYVPDWQNQVVRRVAFNPMNEGINPSQGRVGTKVIVKGKYFGTVKGASTIRLGNTVLPTTHWSNEEIHAVIPTGAKSGNIVVMAEGGASNGVYYRVR